MNWIIPWIPQVHCGNRSPVNQSDFSTNSLSISRIEEQDSGNFVLKIFYFLNTKIFYGQIL